MTPAPTLPFDDTTADDLACAVAVLADAADRAQRLASLYRTPDHRAWAERAGRAHAAVQQLQQGTGRTWQRGSRPPAEPENSRKPPPGEERRLGTHLGMRSRRSAGGPV